jgi:hypothetical protein
VPSARLWALTLVDVAKSNDQLPLAETTTFPTSTGKKSRQSGRQLSVT